MSDRDEEPFRYPPAPKKRGSEPHEGEPAEDQEEVRAHPRSRPWQNLPPVLQHGPWKRHRKSGE